MKIILALDQATSVTGYATFKDGQLFNYGKVSFEGDAIERISHARAWLDEITKAILSNEGLEEFKVIIEDIQYQPDYERKSVGAVANVTTFKTLAQLQGVLLELLFGKKIKSKTVPASVWRATFNIKGKNRPELKRNTQEFVEKTFGVKATQDECDAIVIGYHEVKKDESEINWG